MRIGKDERDQKEIRVRIEKGRKATIEWNNGSIRKYLRKGSIIHITQL
jgi:hypothetical protein